MYIFINLIKLKMKKLTFIIAFAIITLSSTNNLHSADSDSREMLQLGAKIGANYSNVYDAKGEKFNADATLGLIVGGYVSVPLGKYIGIQPEFHISQKGFQATGVLLGKSYDFKRTTTYIDIPILFAFKPNTELTLLAGPQYSYLVKQSDVFSNASSMVEVLQEFQNENYRKNTLSFLGGADLTLSSFVISGRVGWDLTTNNGDGTSTTPRYKNYWYQLTIGYRLYMD